jgi:outer membrane protein assembly factor BamD
MRTLLLTLFMALLFLGCSSDEILPSPPAEVLYAKAHDAIFEEEYKEAHEHLELLIREYPFSAYAADAELLEADVYFLEEEYILAAESYEAFLEMHPFHKRVDYATYRRGASSHELIDSYDRDISYAKDARRILESFFSLYPDSTYGARAKERLDSVYETLGMHELYVAQLYNRLDKYKAALARIEGLLKEFPTATIIEEALELKAELLEEIKNSPKEEEKKEKGEYEE